eukprot:scaffold125987_cov16-Prasinocladus_malaysianus.AAC.1
MGAIHETMNENEKEHERGKRPTSKVGKGPYYTLGKFLVKNQQTVTAKESKESRRERPAVSNSRTIEPGLQGWHLWWEVERNKLIPESRSTAACSPPPRKATQTVAPPCAIHTITASIFAMLENALL